MNAYRISNSSDLSTDLKSHIFIAVVLRAPNDKYIPLCSAIDTSKTILVYIYNEYVKLKNIYFTK
jgi:hypothetical protein